MKIGRRAKLLWPTLVLLLMIGLGVTSIAFASENPLEEQGTVQEEKVLQVAFPQVKGISETDAYGNHTGLVVDYLNEIAKYTNWKYEYVTGEASDLLGDFMKGKYDLMGGNYYSPSMEEYFAYPEYSCGSSQATLLCRKEDQSIKSYDLRSLNGKTIGVYAPAEEKIRRLKQYLEMKNLNCTLVYYTYEDMLKTGKNDLYEFLNNGTVDLLLGNDMESYNDFRVVASFEAQFFYIVTHVGKQEILDGLNMALQKIVDSSPEFAQERYLVHFPDVKTADIQLNEEEQAYIGEKKALTVAVVKDWYPFYYIKEDAEDNEYGGIVPDLMAEIRAYTGLDCNYVYADTYAESLKMVREGTADLAGCFLELEDAAQELGVNCTRPYITLNNIIVKNKSVNYPGDNLTAAVLEGRTLPSNIEVKHIKYYPDASELIQAVERGEVDFAYGFSTVMEQEMQKHRFNNVLPLSMTIEISEISFAISRPANVDLLTILNKTIGTLSSEEKNNILNQNLLSAGYTSMSLKDMIYSNPITFIIIFMIFVLLLMLVWFSVMRAKVKSTLMENELRRVEAENRAKGDFLSRMSHEIRTPMNAIIGLADLTCRMETVPGPILKNLNKIQTSSHYLLSLINDILDMSKIDHGMLEINAEGFSLSNLMEQLTSMMEVQAEQHQVQFVYEAQINHEWLQGDAIRLRQVLTNLLSNAFKFTPKDGFVWLKIQEISSDVNHAEFYFVVKDTGIGIAKEDQEKIFGAFEQLGSNFSKLQGTGLGLPISYNIVELMGGKLQLESQPDVGSSFFFTLQFPLAEAEQDDAFDMQKAAEHQFLAGVHILLAEDNDLNAEIAKELLQMQGAIVERAVNGQDAIEKFMNDTIGLYQIILMDLKMPIKDGLEATKDIRNSAHPLSGKIPIIAMTANTFKEDIEAALAAGMNDFIPKPVDSIHLFQVIRKHISESLALDEKS